MISALTLAACAQGGDSTRHSPRTTIISTVPTSMKPATSPAQNRTVASIKAEVATLDADMHVTTLTETKAVSARRGNVTLTGYFYDDTLRKIELEQPTTRTFSGEGQQSGSLVHLTHDDLVDGMPPETYYFAADGALILARTWGTRSQGGNTDYALQTVDYYFNGDDPLARLVDGAPAAMLNYAYQYDAVDLRREIDGFVRQFNPSPSGR